MIDRILDEKGKRALAAWALLWAFLVACSCRFLISAAYHGADAREIALYQTGTLAFNYFDFGAIRRGLGGSIVHLLPADLRTAVMFFHVLCGGLVALAALALLRRSECGRVERLAFILVFALIALRWGDDGGRSDMAVAALLAAAALAARSARPVLAMALVGVGLFVHETALIFGAPLLLALWWQGGGWRQLTRGQRQGIAAVFAATVVGYLSLGSLPHASVAAMVEGVRGKLPSHPHVDWAIYFAVSGLRGVQTSICQNIVDPNNWLHPSSGLVLIGLTAVGLGARRTRNWAAVCLAALPGFIFLCIVANDDSRWAMFACFNVWLVRVSAPLDPAAPRRPGVLSVLALLALVPLVSARPSVVEYRIYAPSPFLEGVARRLGGPPTPSVEEALLRCDPGWREVLDGKRD